MVKAAASSAMDLSSVADRVNAASEARRRAIINDPDEAVYVVERGQKRRRNPEIYRLDTMAIVSEQVTRKRKAAHKAKDEPEDEFPLLRSFGYGIIFAMILFWIAEMIVWYLG